MRYRSRLRDAIEPGALNGGSKPPLERHPDGTRRVGLHRTWEASWISTPKWSSGYEDRAGGARNWSGDSFLVGALTPQDLDEIADRMIAAAERAGLEAAGYRDLAIDELPSKKRH